MVNNLILWSCISANHEGLKLAERLGVDPERLRAVLLKSSAANWAARAVPPRCNTNPSMTLGHRHGLRAS